MGCDVDVALRWTPFITKSYIMLRERDTVGLLKVPNRPIEPSEGNKGTNLIPESIRIDRLVIPIGLTEAKEFTLAPPISS